MDMKMDKDTQQAWTGWVNFTNAAALSVVVISAVVVSRGFHSALNLPLPSLKKPFWGFFSWGFLRVYVGCSWHWP